MLNRLNKNHKGFTIIELMIATTVFSVILLICTTGLIQIGRMYQKNVIRSQTQEVSRSVVVAVAEAIQFSGGSITALSPNVSDVKSEGFCVDNKRFSYRKDFKLVDTVPAPQETNHALVVDSLSGCIGSEPQNLSTSPVLGNELLSPNMRLLELTAAPEPGTADLYKVTVAIAYGDADLLDGSGNCISVRFGGSFCAVSRLSTTVKKRIIR